MSQNKECDFGREAMFEQKYEIVIAKQEKGNKKYLCFKIVIRYHTALT